MEVYKILKIWGTDDVLARCGLMHSEQQQHHQQWQITRKLHCTVLPAPQLLGEAALHITRQYWCWFSAA
jgi:hypothetical protein